MQYNEQDDTREAIVTTAKPDSVSLQTVELSPSYKIPLALILLAVPVIAMQLWLGLAILLLGLFLTLQAAIIRLKFTATTLDVYRGQTLIRSFPYQEWQNWCIFWPQVPILFYFKETKSIHFLPIIFNVSTLHACLEERCPLPEPQQ